MCSREPVGEVRDQADEDAPLHHFDHPALHGAQRGGEDQARREQERQHQNRLKQLTEGHGVNQGLNGQGKGER